MKTQYKIYPYEVAHQISLKKIYLPAYGQVVVKRDNLGTDQVISYDFRNLLVGHSFSTTNYDRALDFAIHPEASSDSIFIRLNQWHASTAAAPEVLQGEISTYPNYIYLASGETETTETATETVVPNVLTFQQKRQFAIDAIQDIWRPQKRSWLLDAAAYTDLDPDVPKLAGRWLRAAERALQVEFENRANDPLVVEEIARQMALGALDIDTVEKFAQSLETYKTSYPNGPPVPVSWTTHDGVNVSSVQRTLLSGSTFYQRSTLPSTFDSTSSTWLVANEPGIIVFTPALELGVTSTAQIQDRDGVTNPTITLDWSTDGTTWTSIPGHTGATFTPTQANIGRHLRARGSYTDFYGAQTVESSYIISR